MESAKDVTGAITNATKLFGKPQPVYSGGVDVHGLEKGASEGASVTDSLQALKALRALRAFRPLRMISRNKGMKLIVNALISSLPSMTNVTIVCLFLLLIFAILGVNFFKGKFQRCSIEDDPNIKNIADCLAAGGTWDNRDENFDNVLYGTVH
jgi:hypothetical protein